MELNNIMTEEEMQSYANNKEGCHVEFLYEYAIKLGFNSEVLNEGTDIEEYLFSK